ncbi:MAG: ectonucleotide pyrophosphatase/phosphodiesterase [Salinivirgaceae bacterium]
MKKIILFLLIGFALVVLVQDFLASKKKAESDKPRPYLVVLSLDGFRWDYQQKAQTPWLDSITRYGVKAEGLQPAFPSKTFPNHYTIATGLYPGNHELISNSFFAPDLNLHYAIRDRSKVEDGRFYKGEPIWVTAEAQKVKTGSYFWVGSEATIKGYAPTYSKKYEHNFPYMQRVDSVIDWLQKPYRERPKLVMWYLAEADDVGHRHGPDSPQIVDAVQMLDSVIGAFMTKAQQLDIRDSLNFLIVSDHGMGAFDLEHTVYFNEHVKSHWIDTTFGGNPFMLVQAVPEYVDSVALAFSNVKGVSIWKKEDLPERFHLKQSRRLSNLVMVADSGWSLTYKRGRRFYPGGTHGYDNQNRDMYGIFYAIGPKFKAGYDAGILYNTDIYNLMAKILEIKPAPNDGNPEQIMHVLKETKMPEN